MLAPSLTTTARLVYGSLRWIAFEELSLWEHLPAEPLATPVMHKSLHRLKAKWRTALHVGKPSCRLDVPQNHAFLTYEFLEGLGLQLPHHVCYCFLIAFSHLTHGDSAFLARGPSGCQACKCIVSLPMHWGAGRSKAKRADAAVARICCCTFQKLSPPSQVMSRGMKASLLSLKIPEIVEPAGCVLYAVV